MTAPPADGTDVVDVLVVGYGPVGQLLACLLGRDGHRVIVCERHPERYPTPRAGHFDHEIMRIFQSIGVAGPVEAVSSPARTYEFLDRDGRVFARLPRDWPAPSGWDASYHFYQPELERILDDRAREFESVTVRRGVTVTGVTDTGDGVAAEVIDRDGRTETIRARFAIGADGANSTVRAAAGIEVDDLGFEADWLVVDVRVRDGEPIPDIPDTGQICDPSRPSHMARLAGPYLRWEFMLVAGDDEESIATDAAVWALLRRWLTPGQGELIRRAVYRFRSTIARDFRTGRLLLAGDAAHLMPPFLGQGMCSGIRDAATLAWMLDLVLRGVCRDQVLDGYAAARRPHVAAYIGESVRVGALVCETDPERAAANVAALSSATAMPAPFQPPIGAGFRAGDPLAGGLSVQPRVSTGTGPTERLDDVLGPGFQLLTTCAIEDGAAGGLSAVGGHVARIGGGAGGESLAEDGDAFTGWLRAAGVVGVLVRPDHYVYASAASASDVPRMIDALRQDLSLL